MLHPVGPLPARVYWRRRVVLLTVLLALAGGGGWFGYTALAPGAATGTAAASSSARPAGTPALERVVPSLAAVRTPDPAPTATPAPSTAPAPSAPSSAEPTPGGPCTDDVVDLTVRAPREVTGGSKPVLDVVVRNAGRVPCVRALDRELLEVVLVTPAGERVWGSNDCFPEQSDDRRTLRPGETAVLSVVWGGLTSRPDCAGERVPPPAGDYLLRARLDTDTTPDAPLRIV